MPRRKTKAISPFGLAFDFEATNAEASFGRMADQYVQTRILAASVRAAQRPVNRKLLSLIKSTKSVESGTLYRDVATKIKSYKKDVIAWGASGVKRAGGGKKNQQTVVKARQTSRKKAGNPDGRNRIPAFYFHLIDGGVSPHKHPVRVYYRNGRRVVVRGQWTHPGFPARNLRRKAQQATTIPATNAFSRVYKRELDKEAAKGLKVIK